MILVGDALACLRTMPSDSVHCVVTSPPYWGLRDYGVPPRIWGGDPDCRHRWGAEVAARGNGGQQDYSSSGLKRDGRTEQQRLRTIANSTTRGAAISSSYTFCQRCNAWRGVLGLEPDYR